MTQQPGPLMHLKCTSTSCCYVHERPKPGGGSQKPCGALTAQLQAEACYSTSCLAATDCGLAACVCGAWQTVVHVG